MIDRRSFLKSLAGLTAGLILNGCKIERSIVNGGLKHDRLGRLLPYRILGRTGEAVTMLGVGGWHIGRMNERDAQATIETALEGGIRFFDTAERYQSGGSERHYGKFLTPQYRDMIYLMTKTQAHDADTARKHLDGSLLRMKTDYLDLWQIHNLVSPEDVEDRMHHGLFKVMMDAKESGKVRHIGFTGHTKPSSHLHVLNKTDIFDTCQMPVNLADPGYESFIKNVLPKLFERKIGILAMKTLSNGGFFGGSQFGQHGDNPRVVPDRVSISDAIHFVLSLPVSVLITGPDNPEQMKEKINLAHTFTGMDEVQRNALVEKVADLAGKGVEYYKA